VRRPFDRARHEVAPAGERPRAAREHCCSLSRRGRGLRRKEAGGLSHRVALSIASRSLAWPKRAQPLSGGLVLPKTAQQGRPMVAGPGVYICGQCVSKAVEAFTRP